MDPISLGDDLSTNGSHPSEQATAEGPLSETQRKARAVVDLLHNKVLSDTFGQNGEYEVRTTIVSGREWRYRNCVFRHGRIVKRGFYPCELDRTWELQKLSPSTEEMRIAFTMEAVDLHFTRCQAVREYATMSAIFSSSRARHHGPWWVVLGLVLSAALVTVYGFWWPFTSLAPDLLDTQTGAAMVRWEQPAAFYTYATGEVFTFALPSIYNNSASALPVEVGMEPSNAPLGWLRFDREALRVHGVAPLTMTDKTYEVVFRASAHEGGESLLRVYLTITRQRSPLQQPPPLPPSASTGVVSQQREADFNNQFLPPTPLASRATDSAHQDDCLLKILRGESCSP
jgi:hypothetical protein